VSTSSLSPSTHARRYTLYAALSLLALLIHGYHPFASDGGLYAAGIRHVLDPSLYHFNAPFVTAFTHHSIFAILIGALVRLTHLPLAWALLLAHLVSLWLFLWASHALAARVFAGESARWFAVLLAAACCALPVAGTALVLMDPYLTARSFSTPLSLFAVAACLDRKGLGTVLLLTAAVLFHPLMGAYAIGFVLVLALIRSGRSRSAVLLSCAGLIAAGIVFAATHNAPVSPGYREALLLPQRTFLFLARWHWYELLGIVLPLLLFAAATQKFPSSTPTGALCRTAIAIGTTSFLIAALFVPPSGPYLLVPLQVLRSCHLIYLVGVVLCGGVLSSLAARSHVAAAGVLLLLAAIMFQVERVSWPGCNRIERPGLAPSNPCEQAFLWIRRHTPSDATFAFNPQFAYRPGEDEQNFRALAERDALADDKDAGVVAILPSLAGPWAMQRNTELFVDSMTDAERYTALAPLGVTWLLLPPDAPTSFPCPFSNLAVKVCQLEPPPAPRPHPKANGPGHIA